MVRVVLSGDCSSMVFRSLSTELCYLVFVHFLIPLRARLNIGWEHVTSLDIILVYFWV